MKKKHIKFYHLKLILLDFARFLCWTMPVFFRVKKEYMSDNSPKKLRVGTLVVSNHTGFLDPLLIGCAFWYRRMFYLVAEVVMRKKFLGNLLKICGCFEINRNICDMDAIRKAVSLLSDGHTVTVFPQGGISSDNNIESIKSGIILIAMQAKVPIVPLYVHKKDKNIRRNITIIGEPVTSHIPSDGSLPSMSAVKEATEQVLYNMNKCKEYFDSKYGGNTDGNS